MQIDPASGKGAFMAGFPAPAEIFPWLTGKFVDERVPAGDQVDIYWSLSDGSKGPYLSFTLENLL
jgi:hypothetical protein